MKHIIPDIGWNNQLSSDKGVPSHCPFAIVDACPRFYQSLSLFGNAGSTPINPKEDERLQQFWLESDLWPKTDEQFTSISGSKDNPKVFSNICPEVAHQRFGYFASELIRYTDIAIQEKAHEDLGRQQVDSNHWKWQWGHILPMHYTECPLYSILYHRSNSNKNSLKEAWYKRPIGMIGLGIVIAVIAGVILELFF